jgi:uncharacterized cupredoxin-like copper-binding protein
MDRSSLTRPRPPAGAARLALAGLALVLAACAPPGAASGGAAKAGGAPTEIRVVATDFKFEPASLRLPVGRPVTVVLDNKGKLEHDVSVDAVGLHLHAAPGKTAKAVVTAAAAGTYAVDCTIPGHKEAGMTGSLVAAQGG